MNLDPLEASVQEELKAQTPVETDAIDPLGDLGGDIVTPEQLSYRQEKEKYQTLPMAGLAALAGAARGATFGASDVILRGAGLAEPARKLQAYLPEASMTGEVLAGIGGAFIGPGALVAKGAAAATAGITRPVLRAGAREAAEGALYGVGQTISDQALGTPESVAESLVANVGLGAIVGGTFGMGMHGVAEGAQALKGQVSKFLKGDNVVSRFMGEADEFVLDEFKKTAPNIEELKRIAKQEGIPLTKGMLSDSEIIRGLESSLAQKPTAFGQIVRQEVEPTYKAFQKQASKIVEDASEDTIESISDSIKNELTARIHQVYDPASAAYQKINQDFNAIILTPDKRERLVKLISNWAESNTLRQSQARKAAMDSIDNMAEMIDMPLSKIKEISSDLGQRAQNMRQTGFANEARLTGILKDKVDNYLERQVKRAAIEDTFGMPNSKELQKQFISEFRQAQKGYGEFMSFMKEVGEEAGLGKVKSLSQFMDQIEKIDSAKLAKNLFDVKSPKTLKFLKESFPDIFEQYRRIEIAKLAAKTQGFDKMGNSITDVLKLKKELDKYAPESAQLILGKDKIRTINNLHELYRKIPRKIGPSGTPEGMWYSDLLKPAMWAADFTNYGIYKAGQIATDVQSKQTKEITNRMKKFITGTKKTIVPASTIAITSSFKDYQKNLDYVQRMATNPDEYASKIDESTKGLAQIDPTLQQAIANTSIEAVSFMQTKAPKNPFADSMFQSKIQWKPSDAELSKFNRYLKAVDDPFSILTDLEQGVLTSEGVEAVKTIYPDLYNKFVTEAVKQVGEHEQDIPFSKQLQLSLLLGQPLTNAQDAQMMQRLQQGAQASGAQEEAQAQGGMRPNSKKIDGDFLKGQMSQSEQLQRSRGQ